MESNKFKPMPEDIEIYNASNEPCDMMSGPCVCGAWHSEKEIKNKLSKLSQFHYRNHPSQNS